MRGGVPWRLSAALLLALARGVHLRSKPQETSHQRVQPRGTGKYAVAMSWFVKPGAATPAGFHRTANMCCPLLLALRGGAARCRGALPGGPSNATAPVDQVLYVERGSFGEDAAQFMESHGVRVVDIRSDAVMRRALPIIEESSSFNIVSNEKKLAYLWHTDYDAVLEIDYDILFDNASAVDVLGAVTRSNKTMLTFTAQGTITAGGILAVRPSEEFGTKFLRALRHGYSLDSGWGGDYPADLPNITRFFHERYCKKNVQAGPCCKTSNTTHTWCLAGVETDQGILQHLAFDGKQDRRVVQGENSWETVGATQYVLDPKPWRSDLVKELDGGWLGTRRQADAARFWSEFEARHAAFVEDVGECRAYYRTQHEIFNRCNRNANASSEMKRCHEQLLL